MAPTGTKSANPAGSSSHGARIPTSPRCGSSPSPSTADGPRPPHSSTPDSNAGSEGINRVIKPVARAAFGFRNADKQRLRTRCVTARRACGHLRTAQL
ncbi:transposase [Streptomyces flaveolus]|uniref:transposase n=1 Tax=Streptomyces flaveolus TaxID=67297 RepID=UPI0033AFDC58